MVYLSKGALPEVASLNRGNIGSGTHNARDRVGARFQATNASPPDRLAFVRNRNVSGFGEGAEWCYRIVKTW